MAKYLMIFSQCIIQFCEFDFCFGFQPKFLVEKVDSLLSFMHPFYLGFWSLSIAWSRLFVSASMLSLDSLENK